MQSKIFMKSMFFTNKRAFRIHLTCLENSRLLRCMFWNFYRSSKPCSGSFAGNGDPKGRHIPDNSDIEVPPFEEQCKVNL